MAIAPVITRNGSYLRTLESLRGAALPGRTESQRIIDIEREVSAHLGSCRALFVEDSLFRDHLAYVEVKPPRKTTQARVAKLYSLGTGESVFRVLRLDRLIPEAERSEVILHMGAMFGEVIWLEGNDLTRDELAAHIKLHAPRLEDFPLAEKALSRWIMDHRGDMIQGRRRFVAVADPQLSVFADIPREHEAALITILQERGSGHSDHSMEVPSYPSWATIIPGKRWSLELEGGGVLHYLPHHFLGEVNITKYRHAALLGSDVHSINRLRDAIEAFYAPYTYQASQLVQVHFEDEAGGLMVERIQIHANHHRWGPPDPALEESLAGGVRVYSPDEGYYLLARWCTETMLEASKGWERLPNGRYLAVRQIAPFSYQAYQQWQGLITELAGIDPVNFEWISDSEDAPDNSGRRRYGKNKQTPSGSDTNWRHFVECTVNAAAEGVLSKALQGVLSQDPWFKNCITHHVESFATVETLIPTAPLSERGVLRIEANSLHDAVAAMVDLDLMKGLTHVVPYNALYRGRHRQGRVIPWLGEYVAGKETIAPPKGCMVIHGMTGVKSYGQVIPRLESMAESGGLLSVSERRRMQLALSTMSPLGDIASGVDYGVPCKIGNTPSYGKFLYFGLKPEVLRRRDLWFSNQDFGGGRCRYDYYRHYAEQIGQKRIFHPASHPSRMRHLEGVAEQSHNEVWFRYGVSWDEIDTLFVSERHQLNERVAALVEQWIFEGRLPGHIRVLSFEDIGEESHEEDAPYSEDLVTKISKRADELAAGEFADV